MNLLGWLLAPRRHQGRPTAPISPVCVSVSAPAPVRRSDRLVRPRFCDVTPTSLDRVTPGRSVREVQIPGRPATKVTPGNTIATCCALEPEHVDRYSSAYDDHHRSGNGRAWPVQPLDD